MSNLIINIEIMAGTDIADACHELIRLAEKTGTVVMAGFNGVELMAIGGDSPSGLVAEYHRLLDKPNGQIARSKSLKHSSGYHYSANNGGHPTSHIQVLFNGSNVTNKCKECVTGVDGWVDLLSERYSGQTIRKHGHVRVVPCGLK